MGEELFFIGAGFNRGANDLVDLSDTHPMGQIENMRPAFPLVSNLAKICFPDFHPIPMDIESAFSLSYKEGKTSPLKLLVNCLERADFYIGSHLAQLDAAPYNEFVDHFPDADFLTSNYDALIELLLAKRNRWSPHSGFGFEADLPIDTSPLVSPYNRRMLASAVVLHLHGSLYFYPKSGSLAGTKASDADHGTTYQFDPHAISNLFPGLRSEIPSPDYSWAHERFIPPIKGKGETLENQYYRAIQTRALGLVRECATMIAIGYSFADSDRPSYDSFLRSLFSEGKKLLVVGPEADESTRFLLENYRELTPVINSISMNFTQWVEAGCWKGSL